MIPELRIKPLTEVSPDALEKWAARKREKAEVPLATRSNDGLPDIENAADSLGDLEAHPVPEELVARLLHRGSKGILGGGSKSFKTWTLLDLGISVANGVDFLGLPTRQARVLFVNLEIQTPFFWRRVHRISEAKGVGFPAEFDAWNLRGYSAPAEILLPKIEERIRKVRYGLIVLDPIYKILGDRDENSSGDVADMLNKLERLGVMSGAAVVFGAHFAKGNASQKDAIDRVSGSGSFARDPDSIVMMTPHEEDGAFTVEAILRNFPPMESFVVRRDHPLMVRDDLLDPTKLKKPKVGREARTVDEIPDLLTEIGATASEWKRLADEKEGIGKTTFYKLLREAGSRVYLSKVDNRYYRKKP